MAGESNSAGVGGGLPPQTDDLASFALVTDGETCSWTDISGGGGITDLTGDVTGTGPGSTATTITNAVKSVAAVGSTPSANGASIATTVLTLQPADATHPGVLTTGTQSIAGAKTFTDNMVVKGGTLFYDPFGGFPAIAFNGASYAAGGFIGQGGNLTCYATNKVAFTVGTDVLSILPGLVDMSVSGTVTTTALKAAYTTSVASPGAATINKPAGKSAIALGASSVNISNSLVAATDIILITPLANDATAIQLNAVPTSGHITVTANANATADLPFSWFVIKTA